MTLILFARVYVAMLTEAAEAIPCKKHGIYWPAGNLAMANGFLGWFISKAQL